MQQYEPVCKIPYLTLISEFLRNFRELHSRLDIIDRFGKDCLTDITDIPIQRVFQLQLPKKPMHKSLSSRNS
jgi:hypothetical protein